MDEDDGDTLFFFCCLAYKQVLKKRQEMGMKGSLLHFSVLQAEVILVCNERAKRRQCADDDDELSVCSSIETEWRCLWFLALYSLG
jgi:hypothetical protein